MIDTSMHEIYTYVIIYKSIRNPYILHLIWPENTAHYANDLTEKWKKLSMDVSDVFFGYYLNNNIIVQLFG
jgi:hypothetical protein